MKRFFTFFKNHQSLIATFIIILGLSLRLYRFNELFYYAIDEEKGLYIIRGITTATHFPTVGHPSSIGFRLGPLLYYLLAPVYKIFRQSPLVWGYISVLASIFTMILIYQIGKRISNVAGLLALAFYSFSYFTVLYDRRGWQVSFHSLIALTIFYSLLKLKKGSVSWLFILIFALIAASQFEVATLLFIPFVIIAFLLFHIPLTRKQLAFCLVVFLLSQSGLILFDIRHQFLNTRYFINYFRPQENIRIERNVPLTGLRSSYLAHNLIPGTLTRAIFPFGSPNLAIQYANCPQYLSSKQNQIPFLFEIPVMAILLFGAKNAWDKRHDKKEPSQIIVLCVVLFTIYFSALSIYTYIFQGEMAEYYLIPTFSFFFIVTSYFLSLLFNARMKWGVILGVFLFAFFNIYKLLISENSYGFKQKIDAVKYALSKVDNKPFRLNSFQTCWYSGGYRYLFTMFGKEPTISYMDQYFLEYYTPDKITLPQYDVTILTPELVGDTPKGYKEYRDLIRSKADFRNQFGEIEVYIKKI